MRSKLSVELLEQGDKGDDAIDKVLAMASNGDIQALEIIKEAIEFHQ